MKFGFFLKIFTIIYLVFYTPLRLLVNMIWILQPFSKLNTILQLKKKAENFKKCRYYIRILKSKT